MSENSNAIHCPVGWSYARLTDICEKIQDGTHFSPDKERQFAAGDYPYVTAKNVRSWGIDLSEITYLCEEDHRKIYGRCDPIKGDVLLVKDGVNTGDAAVNTFDGEISLLSSVCMLRPRRELLEGGFLRYYLSSPQGYRSLTGQMSGTAIKRIVLHKVRDTPAPIAPLAEQRKIVETIDELFSDLDAGVAALERAKANLKRYRASVLKAAVEGKLTAEWRARNKDVEPASELLKRILAERRKKWEADQIAKFEKAGKAPPKNWREKYVEPKGPDTSALPTLPEGWCWGTVEQLASQEQYSLAIGPFGSNLKVSDYENEGVPLVFVRNIRSNRFGGYDTKFVSSAKALELFAHSIEPGDVLVTKMGDPPGDACLYPEGLPTAIITADCIKWRLHEYLTQRSYFVDAVNSDVVGSQIVRLTKGVAQQKVSLARFATVSIPLPPILEQQEIAETTARAFSASNATESDVQQNQLRSTRLRQSILKRAFEGKLVPQDPSDEPPGVMLQKVRAAQREEPGADVNGEERRTRRKRPAERTNRA